MHSYQLQVRAPAAHVHTSPVFTLCNAPLCYCKKQLPEKWMMSSILQRPICVGAILNDISNKFGLSLFFTLIPSHKTACFLGGCLVPCVLDFHYNYIILPILFSLVPSKCSPSNSFPVLLTFNIVNHFMFDDQSKGISICMNTYIHF